MTSCRMRWRRGAAGDDYYYDIYEHSVHRISSSKFEPGAGSEYGVSPIGGFELTKMGKKGWVKPPLLSVSRSGLGTSVTCCDSCRNAGVSRVFSCPIRSANDLSSLSGWRESLGGRFVSNPLCFFLKKCMLNVFRLLTELRGFVHV